MKKLLMMIALVTPLSAEATTNIVIDKKTQQMEVNSNGEHYSWPVSTARKGYTTPSGRFHVQAMDRMHYSKLYELSPMPHSIFFNGNIAIHGTPHVGSLGSPHSHGCVRLHPTNAATLYGIVSRDRSGTTITVR